MDKEKDKLKKQSTVVNDIVTSTILDFPINHKFILDNEQGMYFVTIELQYPIDILLIRSSVSLDLVEAEISNTVTTVVNQNDERMVASENNSSPKFCASLRCPNNEKRLRLNVRSAEGEYGDIDITVVVDNNTTSSNKIQQKSAKMIKLPLKPLSLHTRVNSIASYGRTSKYASRLRFSGNTLSLSMILQWIQSIFPEVPQKLLGDENDTVNGVVSECLLHYENVFTRAGVSIEFRAKEVIISNALKYFVIVTNNEALRYSIGKI